MTITACLHASGQDAPNCVLAVKFGTTEPIVIGENAKGTGSVSGGGGVGAGGIAYCSFCSMKYCEMASWNLFLLLPFSFSLFSFLLLSCLSYFSGFSRFLWPQKIF